MQYGISEDGFRRKRYLEIKADLEVALRQSFGDIRTDSQSGFGQIIGVFSDALAMQWETSEDVYYSHYPSSAEGKNLDEVVALNGLSRLNATGSTISLVLSGDEGTQLSKGAFTVRSSNGDLFLLSLDSVIEDMGNCKGAEVDPPVYVSELVVEVETVASSENYQVKVRGVVLNYKSGSNATADEIMSGLYDVMVGSGVDLGFELIGRESLSDGTKSLSITSTSRMVDLSFYSSNLHCTQSFPFISEKVGSVAVFQGDFGVVETPVTGVDSDVLSYSNGKTGNSEETDEELRIRRYSSLGAIGGGSIDAIRASLLQNVENVAGVMVVENVSDTEVDGLKPHSILCVIDGGVPEDIAQEIMTRKSAGIETNGDLTFLVLDSQGNGHDISFSRPVVQSINLSVVLEISAETPFPSNGIDSIRESLYAIVLDMNVGDDVLQQKFFSAVYSVEGVASAKIGVRKNSDGVADEDTDTSNINIAPTEFAKLIRSDITIRVE